MARRSISSSKTVSPTATGRFRSIIQKLTAVAERRGFTIYAVGGFVRDLYLKREPKDLDIMVEGKNGGICFAKAASADLGIREPVVFPRFGTARLFIDGEEIEFVMPRTESYAEHSRKPDTTHGNIEQDAIRRDFTINALFLRLNDMRVLDLTGYGMADMQRRIIRVTDPRNADVIFSEDPLRILRAVRQSVQLGFRIEPVTLRSLRRSVPRLCILSVERVRDELNKMLLCNRPSRAFFMMDAQGILSRILPELSDTKGVTQPRRHHAKDVFGHTLAVLDATEPSLPLRYAALLHDLGKPSCRAAGRTIHFRGHEAKGETIARHVLKRLRLPGDMAGQVSFLVKNHMRPLQYEPDWTDASVRRFARDCGAHIEQLFALARADVKASAPAGRNASLRKLNGFNARVGNLQKSSPVHALDGILDGHELQRLFSLPPGPWIREVKEFLIERQLEDPLITRERAIADARIFLKERRSTP